MTKDILELIEDNVYLCNCPSQKALNAASYFIQHPKGNILVDSPDFNSELINEIEKLGGIKYMFLTHKDDVGEHQKFHDHFKCKRVINKKELCKKIPEAEILIETNYPAALDPDHDERLLIIPTPGHTEGHMVLLYKRKFLFTGDHLAYSKEQNRLEAFKEYNWYSWDKQIESMEKLLYFDFEWLLPGHGDRLKANSYAFKDHIDMLVELMKEFS